MGSTFTSIQQTSPESEDTMQPAAKRIRLEPDSDKVFGKKVESFGVQEADKTGKGKSISLCCSNTLWVKPNSFQRAPRVPKWEELPYVALVEIFRRLPNTDKYNAALACRAWQLPFSRPALWRRGNFRFNGIDDWRALCFASMMGAALRHIDIDCSADAEGKGAKAGTSVENMSIFLTSLLNSCNHQVSSFSLRHMRRFTKYLARPECDVIALLTQFLAAQTSLTLLNLEHAGLGSDDAFQLLMAAADCCETRVQSVSIAEVTCPVAGYDVASDSRLFTLLARFTVLAEISVSHRFLCDDLLYLLASSASPGLARVCVWAGYVGRTESRTTPGAWAHLTLKCSRLYAHFIVKGISHDQSFKDILTPGTPLSYFRLDSGGFTTMINTKVCFDHIITHFRESIRHLELDLHFAFFDDEDDVADLIQQCQKLETLHLTSGLVTPQRQVRMERAVRAAVARTPGSAIKVVTFNGDKVSLEKTWVTTLVDWLSEHL